MLEAGRGTDTIRDFQVTSDFIRLVGGLRFGELSITPDGNNTIVGFDNQSLAILTGVQANTLTDSVFIPSTVV